MPRNFTRRAICPFGPANLTANGDGHCPTWAADGDVVLAWTLTGLPATIIGPATSGRRVLNEFWRDVQGGEFRRASAGTPRTWLQIAPAAITADLSIGTIPTGYLILNVTTGHIKRHAGEFLREGASTGCRWRQVTLRAHRAEGADLVGRRCVGAGAAEQQLGPTRCCRPRHDTDNLRMHCLWEVPEV